MKEELQKQVIDLYSTTAMTLQQISDTVGVGYHGIHSLIKRSFTSEHRKTRKIVNYAASKIGELNPMSGKFGSLHHGFIGDIGDGYGYIMVLKPVWYTGRAGSKHVFKHSVVMCQALGITEVPAGFVIHHIDNNPHNNEISNLCLLTTSAHGKLHSRLKGATTISKESRE